MGSETRVLLAIINEIEQDCSVGQSFDLERNTTIQELDKVNFVTVKLSTHTCLDSLRKMDFVGVADCRVTCQERMFLETAPEVGRVAQHMSIPK